MDIAKFNKWLYEEKIDKKRNFYILIGPPAVGKTSWVKKHVTGDSVVISKDDIIEDVIFPKYKLANKDIFKVPIGDLEPGDEHPTKKKLGKVISYKRFSRSKGEEVEERAFEKAYAAGEELNKLFDSKMKDAISSNVENIIVDAIHMSKSTRSSTIDYVRGINDFKIIGVIFPFQGYETQIFNSAENRAKDFLEKYGPEFDRGVEWSDYEEIYKKYQEPSESEGFDELVTASSRFKKTDDEVTSSSETMSERFVRNTRTLLEGDLSNYWQKRAESRSKYARREKGNSIDLEWAKLQQEKSKKINNKIQKIFERDVEASDEVLQEVEKFLETVKKKREELKKKMEEKKKAKLFSPKSQRPKKTLPNPYKDAKVTSKYPYSKDRTGGVAKVFKRRSKNAGGPTLAPGEAFGAMNETVFAKIEKAIKELNPVQMENFHILAGDVSDRTIGDRMDNLPAKTRNMLQDFGLDLLSLAEFIKKCSSLESTKIIKPVGFGTKGFIFLLEGEHILKIFKDDYNQKSDDIAWYEDVQGKMFSSNGTVAVLPIYDKGKIQVKDANDKKHSVKFVETNRLMPFHDFIEFTRRNVDKAQTDFEQALEMYHYVKDSYGADISDKKFETLFSDAMRNWETIASGARQSGTKIGYKQKALTTNEMLQVAKCARTFEKSGYKLHDTHIGNIGILPQSDKSRPIFVIFDN